MTTLFSMCVILPVCWYLGGLLVRTSRRAT